MAANVPPNVLLRNAIFSGRGDSVLEVLRLIHEEDRERVVNERDCRTGSTALHYASFCKNAAVIHLLLEAGAQPALANFAGETPLHVASARNCPDIVDMLLNNDCDPGFPSENLQTPLHSCAIYNSVACAERLLGEVDKIQTEDIEGMTPLHYAAYHGRAEMTKLLLSVSGDPDVQDRNGRTPLHYACLSASLPVIKLLFRASAIFEARDHLSRNCLHYLMLSKSPEWPNVFRFLQKITVDLPWAQDTNGYYPIHYALHAQKVKAAKALLKWANQLSGSMIRDVWIYVATLDPSAEMFDHLVSCLMFQMDASMAPAAGVEDFSVLHYACEWGMEDRVETLLSVLSPNELGPNEFTPLHSAVVGGKENIVELLLCFPGTKVNSRSTDGLTALHVACAQPFPDIANLLIVNDADVLAADAKGRTALMLLANCQYDGAIINELMEIILENGANVNSVDVDGWSALHYAAARGNTLVVEGLLKAGADPGIIDQKQRTALHYAARAPGGQASAYAILEARQQLHQNRDDRGMIALHYAAFSGAANLTVKLLGMLENNQQLPQCKVYRLNPLHLAALNGKTEVVHAIIEWIKSVAPDRLQPYLTVCEDSRRIPLHHAMKYGYDKMLPSLCPAEMGKLLLGWQDKDSVTPLSLAAANGHFECVRYALEVLKDDAATVIKITDEFKRTSSMLAITALGAGSLALVREKNAYMVDANKRGLLHRAAFTRRNDLLKKLVKWQPNEVSAKDVNDVTPLHLACAVGDVDGVQILLEAGADPVARESHGATPGDCAAAFGRRPVLDYLLHGEDGKPRARGLFTSIAICMAGRNAHSSCANALLLEFPRFSKHKDPYGRTPLHLFAEKGLASVVKFLLDCGADVDAVDKDKRIPLQMAAACENGVDCIDLLADNGSDLKHVDCLLNTALHIACTYGNVEVAKALFRHIVEFDDNEIIGMKNHNKDTVLHLAMKQGMKEFVLDVLPLAAHLLWEKDGSGRIPLFAMIDDPKVVDTQMLMLGAILEDNSADTTADESIRSGQQNVSINEGSNRPTNSSSRAGSSPTTQNPSSAKGSPVLPKIVEEEY